LLAPSKLNDTAPEPVTAAAVICARVLACIRQGARHDGSSSEGEDGAYECT
jgi:hypothetical protein